MLFCVSSSNNHHLLLQCVVGGSGGGGGGGDSKKKKRAVYQCCVSLRQQSLVDTGTGQWARIDISRCVTQSQCAPPSIS